ncbi:hypothetical protein RA086_07840 [Lactiplantibacillus sp. WILCCON 0030]|uniref:PTS EIIA type-1 domain-containing protein n=1 Tax=Lactiplantibacillus brownii TaxID=3069269 RepID=A0ABU1A9E1_9LACO|nr:hypothetical protein [Lactiplantibacillus brownii]MDQ7937539.1 hypothetical protein [Lactiplantibacillus brownii]
MWLLHRSQTKESLAIPVNGQSITQQNLPAQTRLAIRPTTEAVHAPIDGEVRELTTQGMLLTSINDHQYWLGLRDNQTDRVSRGQFDWQVRVGDSVSPLTLLGTLDSAALAHSIVICDELIPASTNHEIPNYAGLTTSFD